LAAIAVECNLLEYKVITEEVLDRVFNQIKIMPERIF
jgi:hypothetical protein